MKNPLWSLCDSMTEKCTVFKMCLKCAKISNWKSVFKWFFFKTKFCLVCTVTVHFVYVLSSSVRRWAVPLVPWTTEGPDRLEWYCTQHLDFIWYNIIKFDIIWYRIIQNKVILQEEQSLCFLKALQDIHVGQPRIAFSSPFCVAGVGRSIITLF